MKLLKKYIIALSSDIYTYVGLLIAYFTLDGSAKIISGYLIIGGLFIWAIFLPMRDKNDN
jgi:uncharacterized membrane protein (UPF0136 family)